MDFATRLRVQALLASRPVTSHEEHGWIDHWTREAFTILKALESAPSTESRTVSDGRA